MDGHRTTIPDWRNAAAYTQLESADRSILAWEWLRRVPAYRAAHGDSRRAGCMSAHVWGLHRFENPGLAAPNARPIWTAEAFGPVLFVKARGRASCADSPLAPLHKFASIHSADGSEHVLLSDGWRTIRLDIAGSNDESAEFVFSIPGPPDLGAAVLGLRRFDALVRRNRFVEALHSPVPRAARLVRLLRVADALAEGVSQRELAADLLRGNVGGPRWREDHPHLRLQAQRLVRDARASLAGGYRALLRPCQR